MRDALRRIRTLEQRQPPAPKDDITDEQYARLSEEDLDRAVRMPMKPDGTFDLDRWTDDHHAFVDYIYRKAMGEEA